MDQILTTKGHEEILRSERCFFILTRVVATLVCPFIKSH